MEEGSRLHVIPVLQTKVTFEPGIRRRTDRGTLFSLAKSFLLETDAM